MELSSKAKALQVLRSWRARGVDYFKKLSRREQLLIVAVVITLVVMATYSVYEPIRDSLDSQAVALAEAQGRTKSISSTLERYLKLRARRDAIADRYREVEFKEGALSHLENLIRTKAMVSSGFTIKDSPPRTFGGSYEQLPFSVRFQTSNLQTLIDFLNEVVHGSRPLILGKIDLQRSRVGTHLEVDLDVSSLRKATK